jgi:putative transposase
MDKFQNKYRIPTARAQWHDYNGGEYFITICTEHRQHYFGEIRDGIMYFNDAGHKMNELIQEIEQHHPYAHVDNWQVMPNHVHLIVEIDENKRMMPDNPVETNVETGHAPSENVEINGGTDGEINAVTDGGTDGGMDAGTNVGTDGGMNVGMNVGTDGGMNGGTDDGTDGGTNVGMNGGTDVGMNVGTDVETGHAPSLQSTQQSSHQTAQQTTQQSSQQTTQQSSHRTTQQSSQQSSHQSSQPTEQQPSLQEKMKLISDKKGLLSVAMGNMKSAMTQYCHNSKKEFGWQERFHDHIIRDREEYYRISEYIRNNPGTWREDKFYTT